MTLKKESFMDYEFIKDYKQHADLRISFNELAGLVFEIDFERWYRLGFWNDRYQCYSFLKDGQVVSHVSVNLMELIIDGHRVEATGYVQHA
jgi:hypothetical protein